ncbi:hypothetical protein WJX81_000238 [Elliptochloris bilobata]|uniref:Uncharacterized protein n=1 Tax=Elliptochloris bilobata TaxID=381761 RepID=A0AAW1RDW7_9CHLO
MRRVLSRLYSEDGQRPLYPVCFLTNGGGVTEQAKADQLASWLGVRVTAEQVILSHTPIRLLAAGYGSAPVLAERRGCVADVAEAYGFRAAVTSAELAAAYPPSMLPFSSRAMPLGSAGVPITAVFVFHDPADWYRDLQIIVDAMTSGGVIGSRRSDMPHVPIFFSNPDMVYADDFPTPRLGQGAFAAAVQAVYEKVAGRPMESVNTFSKPSSLAFRLAASSLAAEAKEGGWKLRTSPEPSMGKRIRDSDLPFRAIYHVGDNIHSDIAGARAAGPPWVSVLVTETGVWRGPGNSPEVPAYLVVSDVEAAVAAALQRRQESLRVIG